MTKLLFSLILLPLFAICQSSDTTNVCSRWIEIKPTEENTELFGLDSTLNPEDDLLLLIHDLVENRDLNLYHQNKKQNGQVEWVFIDYEEELSHFKNDKDYPDWKPYFSKYGPKQDSPLTDEYGEPLVKIGKDGFEEYVYPPREVYNLQTKLLDAIKIKEQRITDDSTGKVQFIPTDIGFCLKTDDFKYERPEELFWINLEEFDAALTKNKQKNPLKVILENEAYKGFQYKQVSCNDGSIRYFESRHSEVIYLNDSCVYLLNVWDLGYHQAIVLKLNENCSAKTRVYFGPSTDHYGIIPDIKYHNSHRGVLRRDFDKEKGMYYSDLTRDDQGVYYLAARGCMTYRPFQLTIE